jgi:hypothetical protein
LTRLRDALINDQPGNALALLDFEFEVLLADSQFAGHLLLGGDSREPKALPRELLKRLSAVLLQRPALLQASGAPARLRNNRLRGVLFSDALNKDLEVTAQSDLPVRLRCWSSVVAEANTAEGATTVSANGAPSGSALELLAAVAGLAHNTLLLDRPRDSPTAQAVLGAVVATRGSYMANQGPGVLLAVGHQPEVFGTGLAVTQA